MDYASLRMEADHGEDKGKIEVVEKDRRANELG